MPNPPSQPRQPRRIVPTVPVALPNGATWLQRVAPHPERFERWRVAVQRMARTPDDTRLRSYERIALLAAYDGGWDVRDADGRVLPSPRRLSLRGWNRVPREVIEAMLDHLDAQTREGLERLAQGLAAPAPAPPAAPAEGA